MARRLDEGWIKRQWAWRHNGFYGRLTLMVMYARVMSREACIPMQAAAELEAALKHLEAARDLVYKYRVEPDGTVTEIKRKSIEELMSKRSK